MKRVFTLLLFLTCIFPSVFAQYNELVTDKEDGYKWFRSRKESQWSGKYAALGLDGKILVPYEYDHISYKSPGLFLAEKKIAEGESVRALYDINGKLLIPYTKSFYFFLSLSMYGYSNIVITYRKNPGGGDFLGLYDIQQGIEILPCVNCDFSTREIDKGYIKYKRSKDEDYKKFYLDRKNTTSNNNDSNQGDKGNNNKFWYTNYYLMKMDSDGNGILSTKKNIKANGGNTFEIQFVYDKASPVPVRVKFNELDKSNKIIKTENLGGIINKSNIMYEDDSITLVTMNYVIKVTNDGDIVIREINKDSSFTNCSLKLFHANEIASQIYQVRYEVLKENLEKNLD